MISDVHDPRALATILEKAEAELASKKHPDPYICEVTLILSVETVLIPSC